MFGVRTSVYFRDFVFDFGSERVIGFCSSSFSFYRYHMCCRESVWDKEFSYRIFGGILWVTAFTCLCAMGIWGSHF